MTLCKAEGCNRPHKTKGYCKKHYLRLWRYGTIELTGLKGRPTHGLSKVNSYRIWCEMNRRVRNHPSYKHLNIDERWLDFKNFYEDMGDRPSSAHSLDRIDNTRGYYSDNCRWATWSEQAHNKNPKSKTGYRNIYEQKGRYLVRVRRKGLEASGYAATIEEAVELRDKLVPTVYPVA